MDTKPKIHTESTRRDFSTVVLDRAQLLTCLRLSGVPVPNDAEVYIEVPGGGDWSHCKLNLDEAPLHIDWCAVSAVSDDK